MCQEGFFSSMKLVASGEWEVSCRLPILSVWDTVLTFLKSVDFHVSDYAEGPQCEFQYEHLIG
jgi:hypothetical protein